MDEGKLLALFRQVVREEFGEAKAMVIGLEEASRRLDVSIPTLRRMARRGDLLTVLVGKVPKVPMSEIRRIATPKPSMPTIGRPPLGHQAMARLKAGRLKRKNSTLADELAELKAGRKKR